MPIERKTHIIDAENQVAGRLASKIAVLLQGKHKVSYRSYTDCGDIVHLKNASKVAFTGKKLTGKLYHRFTGYPSGIRTKRLDELLKTQPETLFRNIVKGMLPKNKLQARMLKRLVFIHEKKK